MKVSRIRYLDGVRIDGPGRRWVEMQKSDALQLAKDLLEACGEPEMAAAKVLAFDEPIVGSVVFEGRLLVYCTHSVWEVFEDDGCELRIKMISIGTEPAIGVRALNGPDDFSNKAIGYGVMKANTTASANGMSLDEIQTWAGKIYDMQKPKHAYSYNVLADLAKLVANLAAKMKELVANEQGVVMPVSEIVK